MADVALLPGEQVLKGSAANWIIERQQYGLRSMTGDQNMQIIGMAGQEADRIKTDTCVSGMRQTGKR
jgi:hypothetical protein